MQLQRFVVTITTPYKRIVQVGIPAHDQDEAIRLAKDAYNEGIVWDNTPEMPLLEDTFENEIAAEADVMFEANPCEGDDFSEPSLDVRNETARDKALRAAQYLVLAYRHAKEQGGGRPGWADLDRAHAFALEAVGNDTIP